MFVIEAEAERKQSLQEYHFAGLREHEADPRGAWVHVSSTSGAGLCRHMIRGRVGVWASGRAQRAAHHVSMELVGLEQVVGVAAVGALQQPPAPRQEHAALYRQPLRPARARLMEIKAADKRVSWSYLQLLVC